jgi:hypothetical protein
VIWGKTSDRAEHRRRGRALASALGMPLHVPIGGGRGSRGGAPIWVMEEAYVGGELGSDDGCAIFGRYPKLWLSHVLSRKLLGDVRRDDILHVCSGTLEEKWTVDVRDEARPLVVANGSELPFRAGAFPAVMIDPPYSAEYARNLYGTENPRPSWLLKEAARVVKPSGRIGILHVLVPFAPPGCRLVRVYGVSTGVGFRIRAFTVYEREQDALPFEAGR